MPCRHVLGSHTVRVLEQPPELDPVVADDTGVGRSASSILIDEIIDDPPKIVAQVQSVKRDSQRPCYPARVLGVGRRAASLMRTVGDRQRGIRVHLAARGSRAVPHEHADHLVPVGAQQVRGYAAVHSARHRQKDSRHRALTCSSLTDASLQRARSRAGDGRLPRRVRESPTALGCAPLQAYDYRAVRAGRHRCSPVPR